MKSVILVVFIGLLGAAGFWYMAENAKQERAEQYRRQQLEEAKAEEKAAQQKVEDEKIRKERMAEVAKEDSVRLFMRYLEREEDRLSEIVEDAKLKLEMVNVDQQSLSDELASIERRNEGEAEASKKRGEKRRDKVERVRKLLKSPTLNRLAATYMGEDLSALRAEFESHLSSLIGLRDDLIKKRNENQKKYEDAIGDVDDEVDRRSRKVIERSKKSRESIGANEKVFKDEIARLQQKILKLESKKSPSPWDKRELDALRRDLQIAELRLAQQKDVGGLSEVDELQYEAAVAETKARRTHDKALDARTRADDTALEEHAHEVGVFNVATTFEGRSLDAIRNAMQTHREVLALKKSDAESKLAYLKESSANLDFLNAEEIEDMRRKVAKRLSVNVTGEERRVQE